MFSRGKVPEEGMRSYAAGQRKQPEARVDLGASRHLILFRTIWISCAAVGHWLNLSGCHEDHRRSSHTCE